MGSHGTRSDFGADGIRSDFGSHIPGAEEDARQWRAARAAILLMGDSGLRRAEATLARREDLHPAEEREAARQSNAASSGGGSSGGASSAQKTSPSSAPDPTRPTRASGVSGTVWTLSVIGKRRKQRTVPVSRATVAALRAHWRDRGRHFDDPAARGPLIAPLWIPGTRTALARHDAFSDEADESDERDDVPYTVDALGRLVRRAVQRLSAEMAALAEFSTEDLVQLANTSAHAFRHTFGTRAVAREMPTDVVQAILGHASLQTTSIYVRAERRRMLEAAVRYYAEDEG